jgi:zona occludens toxin
MINLLIGPPGGGKSYEATVFHVLPALKAGRKVITNLPLRVEMFAALDPAYVDLLEVRTASKSGEGKPFSHVDDYGDPWRHPDPNNGTGPLYIIDEAHEVLPRGGFRKPGISEELAHWFAMHRHEFADVLIISQNYGRVNKDVVDRIQLVYRVKKAVHLGKPDSYIRKVQDGLKGAVVDESERDYEPQYFKLYTSHTKSVMKGIESAAADVTPSHLKWKRWGYILMGLGLISFVATLMWGQSKDTLKPSKPVTAHRPGHAPEQNKPVVQQIAAKVAAPKVIAEGHPYEGLGLHILGNITAGQRYMYQLLVSQNGQAVAYTSSMDLERAGYRIEPVADCILKISYKNSPSWFLRCDLPTESMNVGTRMGSDEQQAAPQQQVITPQPQSPA